jgi:hypothetical protein
MLHSWYLESAAAHFLDAECMRRTMLGLLAGTTQRARCNGGQVRPSAPRHFPLIAPLGNTDAFMGAYR